MPIEYCNCCNSEIVEKVNEYTVTDECRACNLGVSNCDCRRRIVQEIVMICPKCSINICDNCNKSMCDGKRCIDGKYCNICKDFEKCFICGKMELLIENRCLDCIHKRKCKNCNKYHHPNEHYHLNNDYCFNCCTCKACFTIKHLIGEYCETRNKECKKCGKIGAPYGKYCRSCEDKLDFYDKWGKSSAADKLNFYGYEKIKHLAKLKNIKGRSKMNLDKLRAELSLIVVDSDFPIKF